MTEAYIQKKISEKVKKLGGMAIKLPAIYMAGLPDLMILYQGCVFFVEVKKPGGVVSKIQKAMHKRFEACGHHVHIMYDYSIESILDKYQEM